MSKHPAPRSSEKKLCPAFCGESLTRISTLECPQPHWLAADCCLITALSITIAPSPSPATPHHSAAFLQILSTCRHRVVCVGPDVGHQTANILHQTQSTSSSSAPLEAAREGEVAGWGWRVLSLSGVSPVPGNDVYHIEINRILSCPGIIYHRNLKLMHLFILTL